MPLRLPFVAVQRRLDIHRAISSGVLLWSVPLNTSSNEVTFMVFSCQYCSICAQHFLLSEP